MAKRVHVVDVPFDLPGRPASQAASLLMGGAAAGQAASYGPSWSATSSRRTSETQNEGRQSQYVEAPQEVTWYEPVKDEPASGGFTRQKRFSRFTFDNVRELQEVEEGAVLLWMNELAVTPSASQDHFDHFPLSDEGTPPLSSSSSLASSPASFRMNATPSPNERPFTPPSSNEGSLSNTVTPKASRIRLLAPSASPTRARSSSDPPHTVQPPSSISSRLFRPSRWKRRTARSPAASTIQELPLDEEEHGPLGGSTASRPRRRPDGLPAAGLGLSFSDADLPSTPRVRQPGLRFASSSSPPSSTLTPPHAPFASSSSPSSAASSSHDHRPTPSDAHDHTEWEFVPLSVPTVSQGQQHAPPLEPRGTLRKLVRPHPAVRARKSYGRLRAPPAVPTPPPEGGGTPTRGSRAASRAASVPETGGRSSGAATPRSVASKEKGRAVERDA
ncbi:hypothetical protein JCM8097_005940 [Rhodosporidiobolus ruineniae]